MKNTSVVALVIGLLSAICHGDPGFKGRQASVGELPSTQEVLVLEDAKVLFKAIGQLTWIDKVFVVTDCLTLADTGMVQNSKCLIPTDSAKLAPTQNVLAK